MILQSQEENEEEGSESEDGSDDDSGSDDEENQFQDSAGYDFNSMKEEVCLSISEYFASFRVNKSFVLNI